MSFADRLHRLVPDLSASLARFPVPALLSVLLCVYANLDVATLVSNGTVSDNQVYLGGAAAFMAAGAAHYFAQGRGLSRLTELLLALGVAIAAGALAFWDVYLRSSHLFLFAGLLPLLMIAGFLRRDAKQGALWLFNLRLGLAVVLAVIIGLIFAGGISAILASLEFLFNVDLPWRAHEHVWATAASLIAPLYGLSLMPVRLDEEVALSGARDTLIERGVSVLVNYIMVPIAVVYTLILHAYAVKILLDGALPKGQIGLMVSIFAVGGTATWLIAWPWRETGTVLLRFFMRYWFWFTIVPVILLVIAIWERISTYGVTPDRYGIALIAVWLALVTLYLAIRRNRADMRALLGSFAILVLIGSAGPWGANNLSIQSQFGRLVGYFQSEKLLTPENKIVDQPPTLSPDGKREIETILWTLSSMGGLDKLKPYFAGRKDDPFADQTDRWGTLGNIPQDPRPRHLHTGRRSGELRRRRTVHPGHQRAGPSRRPDPGPDECGRPAGPGMGQDRWPDARDHGRRAEMVTPGEAPDGEGQGRDDLAVAARAAEAHHLRCGARPDARHHQRIRRDPRQAGLSQSGLLAYSAAIAGLSPSH